MGEGDCLRVEESWVGMLLELLLRQGAGFRLAGTHVAFIYSMFICLYDREQKKGIRVGMYCT